MLEKLQEIIRRYTDNKEIVITADTVLSIDLGLNSYELVEFFCEAEENLNVEFPDRVIPNLKTIQNILDYIKAYG